MAVRMSSTPKAWSSCTAAPSAPREFARATPPTRPRARTVHADHVRGARAQDPHCKMSASIATKHKGPRSHETSCTDLRVRACTLSRHINTPENAGAPTHTINEDMTHKRRCAHAYCSDHRAWGTSARRCNKTHARASKHRCGPAPRCATTRTRRPEGRPHSMARVEPQ